MRKHMALGLALVAMIACSGDMTFPEPADPAFGKGGTPGGGGTGGGGGGSGDGGGNSQQAADFTINDAGMSLVGDGKGEYQDGVCGVAGDWSSSVTLLSPSAGKLPRSQQASCAGIYPRTATLTLAVRHLSDDPHLDDDASPVGGGVFSVQNLKFGWGSADATTINVAGTCDTVGLRFTSVTYPGTDHVVREDLGGGLWHMYTRPWPDNRAYCVIGGVPTYWHVDMDMHVQIK